VGADPQGAWAKPTPAKDAQLKQFVISYRRLFNRMPPAHELEAFCFRHAIGE
jgi:hypothetical protein